MGPGHPSPDRSAVPPRWPDGAGTSVNGYPKADTPFTRDTEPHNVKASDTIPEFFRPDPAVDVPPPGNLAGPPEGLDQLRRDLGTSAFESAIWCTCAVAAETLAPGGRLAVELTRLFAGIADAVIDLRAGRGFTVPLPLVELPPAATHHDYNFQLRFQFFEKQPPRFPIVTPSVGWNLASVPVPDSLELDGTEGKRQIQLGRGPGAMRFVAVADRTVAGPTAGSDRCDMATLVQAAAERAVATGVIDHVSWTPLVVAYLRPQWHTGMLVVRPRPEATYAPFWFEVARPT